MKRALIFIIVAAFAVLSAPWAAADKYSCTGMAWPDQISSIEENIAPACLEVIEDEGNRYGVFKANFLEFKAGDVTLLFKIPEGSNIVQTFHPPKDFMVKVGKQQVSFSELKRGQEVTVLIPELD